ncbi:hypothetical protein NSTC731_00048 [Nostoc sp. DSM 114167]|jgi:hypothetical protein
MRAGAQEAEVRRGRGEKGKRRRDKVDEEEGGDLGETCSIIPPCPPCPPCPQVSPAPLLPCFFPTLFNRAIALILKLRLKRQKPVRPKR